MSATPSFDLTGKVAIVTGASRGIGAEVAKLLAAHGAYTVVSSRRAADCQLVVDEIVAAGGSAEAFACHIGELEQIEALYAHVQKQHGRLDILVNNAATNPYFGPILDTDPGIFQKTVDVNIRGYFYMSTHGARLMQRSGGGSIVNVASVNGVVPGFQQGVYSITKAAVISMTKTLALELGPSKIRVNAIAPGFVETRLVSAVLKNESLLKDVVQRTPLGRYGQPDEIAGGALYLASDAASFLTGHTLVIDGGLTIG